MGPKSPKWGAHPLFAWAFLGYRNRDGPLKWAQYLTVNWLGPNPNINTSRKLARSLRMAWRLFQKEPVRKDHPSPMQGWPADNALWALRAVSKTV